MERENTRLNEEIAILRANPDPPPNSAVIETKELSLALQRVSEKLELTEATLLSRTTELAQCRSELQHANDALDGAYELASKARGREEEGKIRERELKRRIRAAEEETRMSDLVVQEYADLVRSLEGRSNRPRELDLSFSEGDIPSPLRLNVTSGTTSRNTSTITLVDSLAEGKSGLQKLFQEFSAETDGLETQIRHLTEKMAISDAKLASQVKNAERDRTALGQVQFELERLMLEDKTTAKMVSGYMYASN